jgi:hypothetical protein
MSTRDDSLLALGVPPEAYHLPHPKIELPIILIVRLALIEAFVRLRARCYAAGRDLSDDRENDVTRMLLNILENDLRQKGLVPGFNKTLFEEVSRQREVENFNFTRVEKRPDMLFKLRSDEESVPVLSTQHALFVECKPVDRDHPAGGDYCDEGLQRFVDGDYAWAMQDALMIGYVRDGRSIATHLKPAMKDRTKLATVQLPTPIPDPAAQADSHTEALHSSIHRRPFQWPDGKGPACEITVYHSWHLC